MARPFSYPEVTTLPVGGSCYVKAPASEVRRKVALYGGRNNKRFTVTNQASETYLCTRVERLPVTDTELPRPPKDPPEVNHQPFG